MTIDLNQRRVKEMWFLLFITSGEGRWWCSSNIMSGTLARTLNDFRALHSNLQQLPTRWIDSPPPYNLGTCPVVFQLHLTGRSLVPSPSLSYRNPIIVTKKTPIII